MPEKDTPLYGAKQCNPTVTMGEPPRLMTGANEFINSGGEELAENFDGKVNDTAPRSMPAAVPASSEKKRNTRKGQKKEEELDEDKINPKLDHIPVYKAPTFQSICVARKCINIDICNEIVKLLESIKATDKNKATNGTKIDANAKEITEKALKLLDTTK